MTSTPLDRIRILAAVAVLMGCGCEIARGRGDVDASAPGISSARAAEPEGSSGTGVAEGGAADARPAVPEGVPISSGKHRIGAMRGVIEGWPTSHFEGLPDKVVELPAFVIDRAETTVAAYRKCVEPALAPGLCIGFSAAFGGPEEKYQ